MHIPKDYYANVLSLTVCGSPSMAFPAEKRVRKQLKKIADISVIEGVTVRVNDPTDITHVEAFILSPDEAPTANYLFRLRIEFQYEHPFKPPKVLFINKMWHPKISVTRGAICLAQISPENWKPAFEISTILLSIRAMLVNPGDMEIKDGQFLNKEACDEYLSNREIYNRKALQFAQEDNEGYGSVQFEDLRLSAIQSILAVPDLISYEYHVNCCRTSTQSFKCTVEVIPGLRIYCEKIKPTGASHITQGEFKFKSHAVNLTACTDSLDRCWKIETSNSTFEKKKVDQVDPRKDPAPQCSITIEWTRPEREPHRLTHKFCIEDSEDHTEIRYFDLVIDPSSIPSTTGTETGNSTPTLPQLLHLPGQGIDLTVEVGKKYFLFGVHLLDDKTGQRIRNIETQERGSPEDINREILMEWLQGKGKPVTWKTLVEVLQLIKLNELAEAVNSLKL